MKKYIIDVQGDVNVEVGQEGTRGVFITDANLEVKGKGKLTINHLVANCPRTFFETKKLEYGNIIIGSNNSNDRLEINIISNCPLNQEGNPHNYRVFRPMQSLLIQNTDANIFGASTFSEGGGSPALKGVVKNSRINFVVKMLKYDTMDNPISFSNYPFEFYDSRVLVTTNNLEDFDSTKYEKYSSVLFGNRKSVLLNNTSFEVSLPVYHFGMDLADFEAINSSIIKIHTYGTSFITNEYSNPTFKVEDSSIKIISDNGDCFDGNYNIDIDINDNRNINLVAASNSQVIKFKENVDNCLVKISFVDSCLKASKDSNPETQFDESVEWNYSDITSDKIFDKIYNNVNKISVKYFANGGTPIVQNKIVDKNQPSSDISPTNEVSRPGYTFIGWCLYDYENGYSEPIQNDSEISEDSTLYAMWKCNHEELELINLLPPTNDTPGHRDYYVCKECGEYFATEDVNDKIDDLDAWLDDDGMFNNNYNYDFVSPGTINTNKPDEAILKSTAELSDFDCVLISKKDNSSEYSILSSNNYEKNEGSTVIKLKEQYLNSLESGTYYMYIISTDGYAFGSFIIEKSSSKKPSKYTVPNTGINIKFILGY